MSSKIKVHGKAQSRTVLGIVNAYLLLHPEATLDELNLAFPATLNGRSSESIFTDVRDKDKFVNKQGESIYEKKFFEREDEVIHLADGSTIAMIEAWGEDDFKKAVFHAKQYGIEVAEFEKTERPGQRGGFWLEGLNGYDAEAAAKQFASIAAGEKIDEEKAEEPICVAKKAAEVSSDDSNASCNCKWIPVLLMLLLFLFFMLKACHNDRNFVCGDTEYNTEDAETMRQLALLDSLKNDSILRANQIADSLAAAQDSVMDSLVDAAKAEDVAAAIKDNMEKGVATSFNSITFEKASADLKLESNETLEGLYQFMVANPDAKMRVVGHSSPDGDENFNIELSKERAKSVITYLEARGIEKSRLSFQGMGSKKPISEDPEKNRRVEIQIIK